MSEFITPKKAAALLGVSQNTLRNWEVAGKIVAIKTLGNHRRYKLQDIKNIIEKYNKI